MRRRLRHLVHAILLTLGASMGIPAASSGLQVSPVSLTLSAERNADGLWLSNTGARLVHAQVRVYAWTQNSGNDELSPSTELIVSPPMLELQPGARQLIRVIRASAPPVGADTLEAAYRLAIDELPVGDQNGQGLQFVLHYSVPVFLAPSGNGQATPELQWTLQRDGAHVVLRASNTGNTHAQIAQLSFVDGTGHRTQINDGLFGYVLPGATRRWTLVQPATTFAGGGALEARINGAPMTHAIELVDGAR